MLLKDDTVTLYQFGMVLKYDLKLKRLWKCLVIEVNSMDYMPYDLIRPNSLF